MYSHINLKTDKLITVKTYVRIDENVFDVISTVVHEKYQGQGMAGKLFDALMGYVKDNSLKIIPSCSYIEKKLIKLPNSSDFLHK